MPFDPGTFYHLGFVVSDLDHAIARYGSLFGARGWARLGGEIPTIYRGDPSASNTLAAYARAGGVYIELVQPLTGASTPLRVLRERGEGLYHVGYWVDDVNVAVARAEKVGYELEWRMDTDSPLFAYLADAGVGVHIELVAASFRPHLVKLVDEASVQ